MEGLEHTWSSNSRPTDEELETWEKEYRKGTSLGGFEKSANFVSEYLSGKKFDDFMTDYYQKSTKAAVIAAGFPQYESHLKAAYIQAELFRRRNRIMHWGEVNHQLTDATLALNAAFSAFAALKVIDGEKYKAMEVAWRKSLTSADVS